MILMEPSLLPQGHHQAYQIDPQALLAQNHPLQGLFGQPAPLAYRTDAGYQACSVTSTGATGSSMTSRVRCTHPPFR